MPNTGNVFAGTGETTDRAGLTAWTTPENVTADDTADATCNGAGSDYLVARNFDFSAIPVGATITGVLVRIEASEHSAGTEALLAQLQDETATLTGASKATSNEGAISGTAKAVYTYGSTSDVWSATLTRAIVQDPDFGVRLWFATSHDVRIDFVTMAIEYTEAETLIFVPPSYPAQTARARGLSAAAMASSGMMADDPFKPWALFGVASAVYPREPLVRARSVAQRGGVTYTERTLDAAPVLPVGTHEPAPPRRRLGLPSLSASRAEALEQFAPVLGWSAPAAQVARRRSVARADVKEPVLSPAAAALDQIDYLPMTPIRPLRPATVATWAPPLAEGLSWEFGGLASAVYPRAPLVRAKAASGPPLAYAERTLAAAAIDWVFADTPRGRPLVRPLSVAHQPPLAYAERALSVAVPALSWQAEYPDWTWRRALTAALRQPASAHTDPWDIGGAAGMYIPRYPLLRPRHEIGPTLAYAERSLAVASIDWVLPAHDARPTRRASVAWCVEAAAQNLAWEFGGMASAVYPRAPLVRPKAERGPALAYAERTMAAPQVVDFVFDFPQPIRPLRRRTYTTYPSVAYTDQNLSVAPVVSPFVVGDIPPLRRRTALNRAPAQENFGVEILVPVMSWESYTTLYPPRVAHPRRRQPDIRQTMFTPAAQAAPISSWAPQLPVATRRRALATALYPVLFRGDAVEQFSVFPLSWHPRYPERTRRAALTPARIQAALTYTERALIVVTPTLSWQPSYPSTTWRRRLPVSEMPFEAFVELVGAAIGSLQHPAGLSPGDALAGLSAGVEAAAFAGLSAAAIITSTVGLAWAAALAGISAAAAGAGMSQGAEAPGSAGLSPGAQRTGDAGLDDVS